MLPGGGGGGFTNRAPPSWGPGDRKTFRQWAHQLSRWCILTDLDPARQAAAVSLQLRGSAATYVQERTPVPALVQGGQVGGVWKPPLAVLMHCLSEKSSPLAEETRLAAMTEFMQFNRLRGESTDDLLLRVEQIRERAQATCDIAMSIPGLTWMLLRADGVNEQEVLDLFRPFGDTWPTTNDQFDLLQDKCGVWAVCANRCQGISRPS